MSRRNNGVVLDEGIGDIAGRNSHHSCIIVNIFLMRLVSAHLDDLDCNCSSLRFYFESWRNVMGLVIEN